MPGAAIEDSLDRRTRGKRQAAPARGLPARRPFGEPLARPLDQPFSKARTASASGIGATAP